MSFMVHCDFENGAQNQRCESILLVVRELACLLACLGCLLGNVERGSSAVECRTRNKVSPGSNPPLLPFRRLGIFVLSIDAPVDSAV